MAYKIITAATVEPVLIADARSHLRIVAFGTPAAHPDDDYIETLITSARSWCEEYTGRAFTAQTLEVAYDDFPENEIKLPLSPVATIDSIKYVDTGGTERTASSSLYALDDYQMPNWVLLTYDSEWPETLGTANNVKIRFTTSSSNVPTPVIHAMKLIIGSMYENRQQDVTLTGSGAMVELPMGVYSLLQPYRLNMGV